MSLPGQKEFRPRYITTNALVDAFHDLVIPDEDWSTVEFEQDDEILTVTDVEGMHWIDLTALWNALDALFEELEAEARELAYPTKKIDAPKEMPWLFTFDDEESPPAAPNGT